MLDEMADLLKAILPDWFKGLAFKDNQSILGCAIWLFIGKVCKDNVTLYPEYIEGVDFHTVEYAEEMYKRGWAAIVHDGKVVGYKKEKVG